ncbi:MAG: aminotransferase class I/II-fold pyridoxal phosphate-dependent enzyme, partial [Calditrichaeota bacterium]
KEMLDLPSHFEGVIQDTASSATLCAILTAREQASNYQINQQGMNKNNYRIYCSSQTHSSVDKAVRIAGLGQENLVKVEVDKQLALKPDALQEAIESDLYHGLQPLCVVASLGTTGTTAVDPLTAIAGICQEYKIWLHVDAAFSGTALVLPEYRWMAKSLELADSFVFNPHKWMFTNFDCSAYYVKDVQALINTFSILPEYLKTKTRGQVNDYRDWGIALGRRFRALKLWFVIRNFGVEGIRERVRCHIDLAKELTAKIEQHADFKIMAPTLFNVVFFRFNPAIDSVEELNARNEKLLHAINASGTIYLTHTKIADNYVIRMVIGQTYVEERHVQKAWQLIQETAKILDSTE